MAARAVERPERGLSWIRAQSTPLALGVAGIGALALAGLVVGATVILWANGFTPVPELVRGLRSGELRALLVVCLVLGGAAVAAGWGTYRSMPTRVSREEAVAGAVLGLQAAALAGAWLWFVSGNVEKFASNYLDFNVLGPLMDEFVTGAKNTLVLAFFGESFGVALGLVVAIFAISRRAVVRAPARIYINFFRGTPLIWQMIFIGIGLPIGLGIRIDTYQAAIMALALNTAAYAAEVFRAGIQSIERGQIEAARGLGMSYMQAMRFAIVPQAIRRVIPPLMNEFVILIKDTALVIVLGLTAAQRDIMNVADQAVANSFNPTPYVMAGLGYLAVTLPLIRAVNSVERRLRSGLVGVTA